MHLFLLTVDNAHLFFVGCILNAYSFALRMDVPFPQLKLKFGFLKQLRRIQLPVLQFSHSVLLRSKITFNVFYKYC